MIYDDLQFLKMVMFHRYVEWTEIPGWILEKMGN